MLDMLAQISMTSPFHLSKPSLMADGKECHQCFREGSATSSS